MSRNVHDLATYPARTPDETLLAELGYKQEFKRDFSTLELFGLGFSIIGVLPSIASVLVYSIPYGGTFSMVHGWFVCSFFLIFIGLAMSELGSAAPTAGGVYYWTFKFSSERYRYFLCWVMGYINTITYIAAFTGIEWGCAIQVMAAISIGTDLSFVPNVYHIYGVFVALAMLFFILLNIAICFVVIIGLPVNVPAELKNDTNYVFRHFENMSLWPSGFAFVLGFLAPLWVVGGFDCSVHISEEARNANVAIPWAIMSSTTLACVLGWIINIALAFTMGKDLGNILSNPIGQPLATIILGALGRKGTIALWTFIIIAQFQMGTNILTSSSRQNFAFSRDGALPFSKYLYYINPSTKIPSRCVCFGVVCSILLGLVGLAGPVAAGAIFSMSVVGQYVCNATVITARWLGGNQFKHGPFNLGFMSLPVSVVAVGFMMLMAVILCFPAEQQVGANTMNYTALVLGGVVLLSTLYYFFPVIGGRYWFEGPAVTIAGDGESKIGSDSSVLQEGSEVKKQ
ncbi:gaba permease [Moniliophthora roreri MCA 2997]|uniref:Gaba permease n=1 Tax=Moniliophthora roreri (strain MCA 2997) TaxID=1381753 RepID=V2Y9I2_MONRO|nr:gaba permease [Moniliophthora roreri MCA 2997]